jgi:hypothetical protein
MTIDEEREFLAQWIDKATIGGVLTVPPIHAALVKRLGRDIPMSTTYRLLARHNWRKVQPDTKHPKSDPALQDEFKKIPRSSGSRLSEKQRPASAAVDFLVNQWKTGLDFSAITLLTYWGSPV